jgi:kynureninase
MVSSVLFDTAEMVPHLDTVAATCRLHGAHLLVDAYHHLNVVPFDLAAMGLTDAFVTGGGYKYCQLGEGNCFLRVPPGTRWRPVLTGWFAEFEALERTGAARVSYGEGALAFAGATYDPASHYRGAAVFEFHQQQGLTAERLRSINRSQVALLATTFEGLDIDPAIAHVEPISAERRAGFLAIRAPRAVEIVRALRRRSVYADARGEVLRLGPAPYLRDDQVRDGVLALRDVLGSGE